ncbi:SAM-dependent methyltransferase, partial [bacterium]|nr:SAM-dependent methyltransferase [bacterium]
ADAVFLDADRISYDSYLEEALRVLRPGGMLLVDNAFSHGEVVGADPADPDAPAMAAFNDLLAADSRVESVIVPLGDGLWVGVKR